MMAVMLVLAGCATKLPSEDIEVLSEYSDIIRVLRDPKLTPNSKEKYEAACKLVDKVDLYFTRETGTVNKLFYYRDAYVDKANSDTPVFTFSYTWRGNLLRIRFFTYKMFVTRVEITRK